MKKPTKQTLNNFPLNEKKGIDFAEKDNSSTSPFFLNKGVSICKESSLYKPLDRIKILLLERGLKQSDLAKTLGIARQTLHHYLSGYWDVPLTMKIRISKELNVDSRVIWGLA